MRILNCNTERECVKRAIDEAWRTSAEYPEQVVSLYVSDRFADVKLDTASMLIAASRKQSPDNLVIGDRICVSELSQPTEGSGTRLLACSSLQEVALCAYYWGSDSVLPDFYVCFNEPTIRHARFIADAFSHSIRN